MEKICRQPMFLMELWTLLLLTYLSTMGWKEIILKQIKYIKSSQMIRPEVN
jgi:hypothetical protein